MSRTILNFRISDELDGKLTDQTLAFMLPELYLGGEARTLDDGRLVWTATFKSAEELEDGDTPEEVS